MDKKDIEMWAVAHTIPLHKRGIKVEIVGELLKISKQHKLRVTTWFKEIDKLDLSYLMDLVPEAYCRGGKKHTKSE